MSGWIERADQALAGRAAEGVEVIAGQRPPVLDAEGARALLAPVIAAFFWAGAVFREGLAGQPLDPLALLLRLLALAMTARTLLLGARLWQRVRVWASVRAYALALADEGLVLRTPAGDFAVPREDVIDVVEHGAWGERSGRRWADVYVVTRPEAGRLHLPLPPVFLATPGMLAERLMRWRGAGTRTDATGAASEADARTVDASGTPADASGAPVLPSKLWEELAAGARPRGIAVVPHGTGWLRRGPYATVLLGIALLDRFVRLSHDERTALGALAPLVMALCLVVAPLAWVLLMRRVVAVQRGIALAFTPTEILTRTRAGVQRIPWSHVARFEITSRAVWSILHGAERSRALVVHRKNEDALVLSEEFLGVPAEVALAHGEAYRKRQRGG